MTDYAALKKKVDELAERVWDFDGIRARVNKMTREGIPRKKLEPKKRKYSTVCNCGPRNIT
jgi:hypothetical protein